MVWLTVLIIAVIVLAVYLFCIAPNTGRRDQMIPFENVYIAHRGLFDNDSSWPENSLPAFCRAVENGYGIELDVQLTKDGQLVVFHDEDLMRMCGSKVTVYGKTYEELCRYRLASGNEQIPLFHDVLEVIGGKVPLIVEIKPEGNWKETAKTLSGMMEGYPGTYCVESFHPLAMAWYRKNCPDVLRGQLATDFIKDGNGLGVMERFLLSNLLLNCFSRPDFIAYDHRYVNQFSYRLCRNLFPVENVAWTIKNPEELERARKVFRVFIFDSFIP